jgi:hypothetical protein
MDLLFCPILRAHGRIGRRSGLVDRALASATHVVRCEFPGSITEVPHGQPAGDGSEDESKHGDVLLGGKRIVVVVRIGRKRLIPRHSSAARSGDLARCLFEQTLGLLDAGRRELLLADRHLLTELHQLLTKPLLGDWKHLALFLGRMVNDGIP